MSTCLDTLVKAVWPLSQRPPENVCKYYMQVHHNFEYDDNNKKMNDKRIKAITVSSSDKLQYKKQVFNKQTKRIWAWTIYKRINPIYMIQKQKIVCSGCYLWRWQTYPGRQGCFRLWIDCSSGVWWPGFAYLKGLMFISAHAIKPRSKRPLVCKFGKVCSFAIFAFVYMCTGVKNMEQLLV